MTHDTNNGDAAGRTRLEHDAESPPRLEGIVEGDLPIHFGRYELQALLGEGGMARVFRAELHGPAGFRKAVALKVIKPEVGGKANRKETLDLIREACLGGRLKHPHIVDVYELGEVGGQPFISMELVDGMALSHLIRTQVPVPGSVVMEIAVAVAAGLAKAHGLVADGRKMGLVHRDVKPANILLSRDGAIKVADLGIAIAQRQGDVDQPVPSSYASGTPSYMSPEQVMGEELDGRSDLFAFALVITTLVLGENPLGRRYILNRLLAGQPLEPPLLGEDAVCALNGVAPGLGAVLLGCLEPDRKRRTPHARQVLRELRLIQNEVGHNPRLVDWLPTAIGDCDTQGSAQAQDTWIHESELLTNGATIAPVVPEAKGNLGSPSDVFVGRDEDLSAIGDLYAEGARLVTIKGTGGAGKTRLSRNYARRAGPDVHGGAWFVDLTEARTDRDVLRAVAAVLGLPLTGVEEFDALSTRLGQAIAARCAMLLVLDNFEQVVGSAPSTVGRWLDLAPEACFLVSSREPLRVMGERVFPLGPLPPDDGVALFELRAQAAGARWEHSDRNNKAIRRIVQDLDGLPLAIELAAGRSTHLSPVKLLERLSERFRLLRGGKRGGTARESSLQGLIDWSWDLLAPWEKAALAQLSVFRGGFFMEAAERVLDLSAWPEAPWSLDVVGSLLDKSLLHCREVLEQPRLGMFVSIQGYASEKLGEENAPIGGKEIGLMTRRRHAACYAKLGEERHLELLDRHGGIELRRRLALEMENLLMGVDAGLASGEPDVAANCGMAAAKLYHMQGPAQQGRDQLERILENPLSLRVRSRVYFDLGRLLEVTGQTAKALEAFHLALALHRQEGHRRREGIVLGILATIVFVQGNIDEGMEYQRLALAIHREVGNRAGEGRSQSNQALLDFEQGRLTEAKDNFIAALAIHREEGDSRGQAIILGNLGNLYKTMSRESDAMKCYREALSLHRLVGNRRHEAMTLGNMGNLFVNQGERVSAEIHFQQSITIGDEAFPLVAGVFRGSLALLFAEKGQFDEARTLMKKAEPDLRGVNALELAKLLCKKTRLERLAGDLDAAAFALDEADAIVHKIGAGPGSELGTALAEARLVLEN